MTALREVLASKPTLISSAIRLTLLAGGGLGLGWDEETIIAVMLAVEGWLAVAQALATVPKSVAATSEAQAVAVAKVEGKEQAAADLMELDEAKKEHARAARRKG